MNPCAAKIVARLEAGEGTEGDWSWAARRRAILLEDIELFHDDDAQTEELARLTALLDARSVA